MPITLPDLCVMCLVCAGHDFCPVQMIDYTLCQNELLLLTKTIKNGFVSSNRSKIKLKNIYVLDKKYKNGKIMFKN